MGNESFSLLLLLVDILEICHWGSVLGKSFHVVVQLFNFLGIRFLCGLVRLLYEFSLAWNLPSPIRNTSLFLLFRKFPQITALESLLFISLSIFPLNLVINLWSLLFWSYKVIFIDAYWLLVSVEFPWCIYLLVRWALCHFRLGLLLEAD